MCQAGPQERKAAIRHLRAALTRSLTLRLAPRLPCRSVVVAWAGDSRAVVGSAEGNSYIATQLTRDHTPNKLSEMARILQAGGRVTRPATDARGFPTGAQ